MLQKLLREVSSSNIKVLTVRMTIVLICMVYWESLSQEKNNRIVSSKAITIEQNNTWAIGGGLSNFIMHGDLRSIGTGELGNFWNFGGYLYIDKMFNPILGLEMKFNYNNMSGGAQYFSDIYDVLYVDGTTINNNLFFEGRSFGGELNMILSFSNIFQRDTKKWHLAGYLGVGYQFYNSRLFEKSIDGSKTLLVDFGTNPERNNVNEATSIFIAAQLGLKYRLSKKLDLELRPSWYFNNEDHLDATISDKQVWESYFVTHLGLTVKLGKKESYTIWDQGGRNEEKESFAITDSDGDGVMNELDVEPNTPKGVKVYGNGQAVDSDNDKIPDYKDDCPFEPGTLENKGCPLYQDSDNDGILDHKDLCPMDAGPKENKGCPRLKENDKVTIIKYISELAANIYFDTGKFFLREDSEKTLDQIANYMTELPKMKFKIEGHTDNRDSDSRNLYLSQKRADAVMKYLMRKGIKRKRLSAKGFGEYIPLYSNDTPQGRQLNRRVEIRPESDLDVDPMNDRENIKKGEDGEEFYIVTSEDTLFSIAKRFSLSIEDLKRMNDLKDNVIMVGQQLKIKE